MEVFMTPLDLFITAVGLSMDATAVAICKGLCMRQFSPKRALLVGGLFGLFQAFMPFIGYQLGIQFKSYIAAIDHWIAFAMLGVIGLHMIMESRETDPLYCETEEEEFKLTKLIPLALATSIDALAVGVTFAFLSVDILPAVILIGITTLVLSSMGVGLGFQVGQRLESKAQVLGGIILMGMGTRILIEHLLTGI